MNKTNDIKNAREIGRKGRSNWIWVPCSECGKERWMMLYGYNKKKYTICRSCAMTGARNKNWRGGRARASDGYMAVLLTPESPYFEMANGGGRKGAKNWYVLEHRLVMAKHLGRCLATHELVHHKNGIVDDNRISNLYLSTKQEHMREHQKGYRDGFSKGYQDGQTEKVKELTAEINLLRLSVQKEASHS